jgi:hypothetical protein
MEGRREKRKSQAWGRAPQGPASIRGGEGARRFRTRSRVSGPGLVHKFWTTSWGLGAGCHARTRPAGPGQPSPLTPTPHVQIVVPHTQYPLKNPQSPEPRACPWRRDPRAGRSGARVPGSEGQQGRAWHARLPSAPGMGVGRAVADT